jgi:hypothetical protein
MSTLALLFLMACTGAPPPAETVAPPAVEEPPEPQGTAIKVTGNPETSGMLEVGVFVDVMGNDGTMLVENVQVSGPSKTEEGYTSVWLDVNEAQQASLTAGEAEGLFYLLIRPPE